MIDWDKYKGATSVDIVYRDGGVVIDTCRVNRPTETKNVADAVEQPHFKATRENLEKIAKDAQGGFVEVKQEGEKWTHIDAFGDPCRILIEEKDNLGYVVILRQSGHYATPAASSLKPIKPTISKAQAWDYAVASGLCAEEIESKYDII